MASADWAALITYFIDNTEKVSVSEHLEYKPLVRNQTTQKISTRMALPRGAVDTHQEGACFQTLWTIGKELILV